MPIYLSKTLPRPARDDEEPREARRRDPEATKKAILDAAEELFIDNGPSATSLAQVAKKAAVTKSLIHHHFGTKEELWEEVQKRHFLEYFEIQMRMIRSADSTAKLLEDSIVAYFRYLQAHPRSVRFLSWASLESDDDRKATPEEKEIFEVAIQRIEKAQADREIRSDVEPFFLIKTLIALPMAWFQTRAETLALLDSSVRPADLDELYLRDMVKMFLEGVARRGPET
jgi:TetR/AcrR family transcriptional regulator